MKRFLIHCLLFSLPLMAVVVLYVCTDIFRVIYHYEPFYPEGYCIETNRAYGSTMTYINQNPRQHYDSFIFGNSRSLNYRIDTWKRYLPEGSRCMHFDEFGGSIGCMHDIIAFIDQSGGTLHNALLVVDDILLGRMEQRQGCLFLTPPLLKDNSNLVDFHLQHFEAFLNLSFHLAQIEYRLTGKIRPEAKNFIRDTRMAYIPAYNEIQETPSDHAIAAGTYFDEAHTRVFDDKQHPGTYSTEQLSKEGIAALEHIRQIFRRQHTDYRIVISPMYNQVRLNRATYDTLCRIFGQDRVYDFSGTSPWSLDYHNYYEPHHYMPSVADEIMDIIYTRPAEAL